MCINKEKGKDMEEKDLIVRPIHKENTKIKTLVVGSLKNCLFVSSKRTKGNKAES